MSSILPISEPRICTVPDNGPLFFVLHHKALQARTPSLTRWWRRHLLSTQAQMMGATDRIEDLECAILKVQQVDAVFIYVVSLERMK